MPTTPEEENLPDAERLAREVGIPPCPEILLEFGEEMAREEPDLGRLAGLIGADAALASTLLQTVNSSYYGFSVRIAGVRQALAVLGLRRTANLVGALVIRRAFPSSLNPGMARFWRDSSRDAQAAADLAPAVRRIEADEARTFSLLRRCGMAVLLARFRDYEDMLDLAATAPGEQVLQVENGRYGTNHAEVGHALALRWMLPGDLAAAIRWQYVPEDFVAAGEADPGASHGSSHGSSLSMICFGLLLDQVLALRSGGGILRDWSRYEARVLDCLAVTPDSIVEMIRHEADDACMEAEAERAAA